MNKKRHGFAYFLKNDFIQNEEYADYAGGSKYLTCDQESDCSPFGMICFDQNCVFESEVEGERVVAVAAAKRTDVEPDGAAVIADGEFTLAISKTIFQPVCLKFLRYNYVM